MLVPYSVGDLSFSVDCSSTHLVLYSTVQCCLFMIGFDTWIILPSTSKLVIKILPPKAMEPYFDDKNVSSTLVSQCHQEESMSFKHITFALPRKCKLPTFHFYALFTCCILQIYGYKVVLVFLVVLILYFGH